MLICPRTRRKVSSTKFYHVIAKGINKEKIFNQIREKQYMKTILRKNLKKFDIQIYAYCIMSNHIHLIIKSELSELSSFMAGVLAEYAEYYNYKWSRNGHVFQNRFISECIESERYFWNCLRYIHLNPLKANVVKRVENHKYSSIKEYQTQEIDILNEKALFMYLKKFEDWEDFLNYHNQPSKQVFRDIKDEVFSQKLEVALQILQRMKNEYKIEYEAKILEERFFRTEYKEKMIQELHISKRECDRIYANVKKQIFK